MRLRLLALLLLGAASARAARDPSPVIFPEQKLPLKFSHKQHLGFKLQCDFCHEKAESSTASRDDLVPSEEICSTCHKIDRAQPQKEAKPAARCDSCHVYPPGSDVAHPPRVELPAPNLKFNHKVHADRHIACDRCHGGMAAIDLATRAQLPRMPLCLGCHTSTAQTHRAPAKCTTCHLARPDGTVETSYPSGQLIPSGTLRGDAHTLHFATEHARVAAQDESYCASCHRREFCQSCHNGVIKPMSFHGNDYISIHAIDSRKATTNCNGCHRAQTFCLGCHERTGVVDDATTPRAPGILSSVGRRFHPPTAKWVDPPRTPEHHSWQAERNLRQCVSCHREDTCLACHAADPMKAASRRVSPHPPGFAGSPQCQSLAARNARVCLKCHATSDVRIQSCR